MFPMANTRKKYPGRDVDIVRLYASGKYMTEHIAKTFNLSPRRVQQIVKRYGVVRNIADANRVATPLKRKQRIRKARTHLQLP